ncbi:TRAP transporter substrate-binding protein [Stappia sp. F7233]|uniref:TRAP transporter substrate-binding protein n=1 Tax=Stappia albiluteola TaxID=2758565 RepID=A0A839ACI6_9HYPH|nr:TRAP transporter substrate-binding protein [Stappia albiluteola]MBA5777201.1 TRAP transporter substrate-binding protein [Stappia albiluteola]
MRRIFGKIAFATALGAMLSAPAAAETTLRVSNWLPPSHPIVRDILEPWGRQVEEATGGSVKVEIMASPIGKPPAQFDLIKSGAADIGYGVHGYTPGRFKLTPIVEGPFLSDSAEALSVAYWKVQDAMLSKANEHDGVKLLTVFTHGPGAIYTTAKPVTSLADMEGLKMRIGGGVVAEIAKRLGMVGVQAPSPQVYEILSNGVADGILFPAESVPFFRIDEVIRYGTNVPGGLYNTSFFVIMNQQSWDKLTDAEKAAIDKVSGEALARLAGQAWDAADEAGTKVMADKGVAISVADEALTAAIAEKLAGVEDGFLAAARDAGIDGAAAMDMLKGEIAAATK